MAPNKQGLDYFKYYPGLLRDRKLRAARMKHGAMGMLCYLVLLELIYTDKGYYIRYDDDLVWDIIEVLQGAYCPKEGTVRDVVAMLVASGLFDAAHFEHQILTSRRIQREYYTATVLRKAVEIDFSIWLLSEDEMSAISERSSILHQFRILNANHAISGDNDVISPENYAISEQSTVQLQYSTVTGQDREQAEIGPAPAPPPAEWIDKLPIMLTAHAKRELAGYLSQGMTRELVKWAASVTADKQAGWAYMKSILEDKAQKGIKTLAQLEADHPGRKRPAKKGFAASYDIEDFEQQGFTLPEGF